ncbi:MAG: bifunctional 3-phosphoshikimate 1-carboxyvinyltransferase/cytidylate kinase [Rhodoferax sp.]|nr:bifunctional 3-phosphoshikimate 1-carboxyvinyltransferase/cytidylate kinase [Rhodoferax sp.]HQX61631.1 bifunctional 3-phosphoshikimate 1-carboxyvinyltransferase/cytidylate kinase [Burkholderiaceae bacterium]HQZ07894.1 bifunctional 3-phosphoshikimate 1-carboxyvinyltransferase/cytidylate kinase [Burkholderiaceae bacterium]
MFATEFLDLPPLASAGGMVTLPGSKSISNRVLLLSALCAGTTTLHDLLDSDDTRVMLDALQLLGCSVSRSGDTIAIGGLAGKLPRLQASLFLGNAGTAMRPLTAALSVLGGDFELRGVARMHERPIGDLVDALRQLGCQIDYLDNPGYPPLRIGKPSLNLSQPITVRGDVSSQFLTALLMALPLVAAQDVVIDVVGELISRPYIAITLNLLARFGVQVKREGWQRFTIPAGSQLQSPGDLHIEADASSASYFIALGAIAPSNGVPLRIQGVGADSIQGDIRFVEAARLMGANVTSGPNWLEVAGPGPGRLLHPVDLDCNHIPDAAMTLAVMALYASGTSTLRNIASWRVKETDRIAAMTTELRKFGATVDEGPDFIRITPPQTAAHWRAASVATYDDHRMAMCLSLAAFNPAGHPVRILDPKCVAKTFPEYFEALFSVVQTPIANIPVICVDGPTASGKGTLAAALAQRLGYHFLDSGALYRITALAATRAGLRLDGADEAAIAQLVGQLDIRFAGGRIMLGDENVSELVRTEEMGMNASRVSALVAVRQALIELQHAARRLPGLVADGRDMGTVIFPQAPLKVYLTASAAKRAQRRHKQLISKGIATTIAGLRQDLEARDARDSNRSTAPLIAAKDARLLDNSELTVEESVDAVLDWWQGLQPFHSL